MEGEWVRPRLACDDFCVSCGLEKSIHKAEKFTLQKYGPLLAL